jgi:rhodanese-related sulfurtransferase
VVGVLDCYAEPSPVFHESQPERGEAMAVILAVLWAVILVTGLIVWTRRMKALRELEQYSITPEGLHTLVTSNPDVLVLDVRLPLDLLANSEIIPGARRLAPKEVFDNPALIPKDRDSVVYCTCPSNRTSRAILQQALALGFSRTKFLKGGLEAWKAGGFPVEPYEKSFQLYMAG